MSINGLIRDESVNIALVIEILNHHGNISFLPKLEMVNFYKLTFK